MIEGLFSRAIGRWLAGATGLNGVYLPLGVGREPAREIVREANDVRGDGETPFAIVVALDPKDHSEVGVTEVTVNDATRYREGDRLAVFVDQHADIASVGNTFREVVTPSFPEDLGTGASAFDHVASAAIEACLVAADREGVAGEPGRVPEAISMMASSMEVLAEAHKLLGSSARPWNALWFEHVDTALGLLVDALQRADDAEELESFLLRKIPACFSLPQPRSAGGFRAGFGRAVKQSVSSWWSDGDAIQTTVALLASHADTQAAEHALAAIDWTDFDRTAVASDSPLLALATHEKEAPDRVGAFEQLTESQFTDPVSAQSAELYVTSATGERFDGLGVSPALHLLAPSVYEELEGSGRVCSPELVVRVPTVGELSEVPEGSRVILETTPKSAHFELADDPYEVRDGQLHIRGRLVVPVPSGSFSYRPRRRRLGVRVEAADPLAGQVDPQADLDYILPPPDGGGVAFFPLSNQGKAGAPSIVAPERFGPSGDVEDAESPLAFPAASGRRYMAVAWQAGGQLDAEPVHNGQALKPLEHPSAIWSCEFSPSGDDVIRVGDLEVEVQVEVSGDQPVSPVVAAIRKTAPSAEDVGPTLTGSLRGRLEDVFVEAVRSGRWTSSLGHLVLPSDRNCDLAKMEALGGGEWSGPAELASIWSGLGNRTVPVELRESREAERFREAFGALGVLEALERVDRAGSTLLWPSRVSWAKLWGHDALTEYLTAYDRLVHRARALEDPNGIFWASYPFSASVRSTEPAPGRCLAVLLGPLHPIRLAWLAGVEHTLRAASSAAALAGTVEGWNFPVVGPHDSSNGSMLAVPIDNGAGQLFLGWSMLVEASVAGPSQLTSPEFIAGRRAPGTAASGLNAGGVTSALRDYRRMNPHVTTLTVDLAASLPAPRLTEIDAAVLEEMGSWATESIGLPGGARVLDSLNRRGDAPREQLSELLATRLQAPVTWSRYRHVAGASRATNVRILQDAGVALEVDSTGNEGLGRMARVPLRRFEVPARPEGASASAVSSPGMARTGGWAPFARALGAVEAGGKHGGSPLVRSELVGGLLAAADAEWTISGEAMLNPASLASLLGHGEQQAQMLWEWRPPFLEVGGTDSGDALLERRPYLSIVRVPQRFEDDILEKLAKVVGGERARSGVRDLLNVLGSRGVGLSSLVAMGGSHASGALGFYTALKLMDEVDGGDADLYVMPIDVCDKFLLALAGEGYHASDQQRADLLVMAVTDQEVVLAPIEIKFYGFETAEKNLPELGSARLREALSQLASTTQLLKAIEDRWAGLDAGAEQSLAINGLGSLLEAGMRLSQTTAADPSRVSRRLQGVLDGDVGVRCGRPLLAYFLRGARTSDGSPVASGTLVDTYGEPGCGEHGEFIADPGAVLSDIGRSTNTTKAWSALVTWACGPLGAADADATAPAAGRAPAPPPDLGDQRGEGPSGHPPVEHDPVASPSVREGATEEAEPSTPITAGNEESGAKTGRGYGGSEPKAGTGRATPPADPLAKPVPTDDMPVVGDGIRFEVGELLDSLGGGLADHWPSNTSLNQPNIGVVGDLGTGKTQLLKALVRNLRVVGRQRQLNPVSILIFDYKRDFQDEAFLKDIGGEVLHPQDIPLNIFGIDGEYQEQRGFKKAQTFIDVLKKIFGGIGPVQSNNLLTSILSLYAEGEGAAPTMAEVLDRYQDESGTADAVVGILNQFVLGHVFSSDKNALVPFDDLIHDKVLVVDLNSLGADQSLKNALVVFFLNQYYEYMQRLTKWPYVGAAPEQLRRLNSYLLVDEATNIMQYNFDVLEQLMLQGREFGVGVILASQYLSHFQVRGVNYGEPLRTWFIHKVPNVTQKELSKLGLPAATTKDAERISQMQVHEAYYSSLHYPGRFIRGIPYYELKSGGD